MDEKERKIIELCEWGQIDGDHHKMWVIDQIIRIIKGDEYLAWVEEYEQDGEYYWDEGIAPMNDTQKCLCNGGDCCVCGGGDLLSDTPAVTESLRERLIARALMVELPFIERAWHIIETELQKRDEDLLACECAALAEFAALIQKHAEEKARLVGEFRRLAAKARSISEAAPQNGPDSLGQTAYIWELAAQMLEESKP